MKKILVFMLALAMVLSLAACGGEKDPTPSGNGATDPGTSQQTPSSGETTPPGTQNSDAESISDINLENYQGLTEKHYGITLEVPEGWTLKEVTPASYVTVEYIFEVGGNIAVADAAETFFATTKAVSTDGNYAVDIDWANNSAKKGNSFDSAAAADNDPTGSDALMAWGYTFESRIIQVNYNSNGNTVTLMLDRTTFEP